MKISATKALAVSAVLAAGAATIMLLAGGGHEGGDEVPARIQSAGEAGGQETGGIALTGRWDVSYEDAELGVVRGSATIHEGESGAEVVFDHPVTGERTTLRSTRFLREGDSITIELAGKPPTSGRRTGLEWPGRPIVVSSGGPNLSVSLSGDSEHRIVLAQRRESAVDEVSVLLSIQDEQTLSGKWQYRADPVLHRGRDGFGRAGIYSVDSQGDATQRGWEIWHRRQEEVVGAFAVEEQLAIGHQLPSGKRMGQVANYPHPFQSARAESRQPTRRGWARRKVFIYGRGLPGDTTAPTVIESLSPGVTYGRVHYAGESSSLPPEADPLHIGRERLREDLENSGAVLPRDLEAVWVEVELRDGVVPGDQSFTFNGVEAAWVLQFGDNRAGIQFVRPVDATLEHNEGKGFQPTSDVFLPEVLQLEIRTSLDLDVDPLLVAVARNGDWQSFENTPFLPAWRVDSGTRVYRTDPIELVRTGPDTDSPASQSAQPGTTAEASPAGLGRTVYRLPVGKRDTLVALLAPGPISVPPRPAVATVHTTPARLALPSTDHAGIEEKSYLWKDFLLKASECWKTKVKGDWDRANYEYVDEVNSYLLIPLWWLRLSDLLSNPTIEELAKQATEGGVLSTDFQLADHAAMLILREAFIDEMNRAAFALEAAVQDDRALTAYWLMHEPDNESEASNPFADLQIRVTGPDGVSVPFWWIYLEESARRFLDRPSLDELPPAWILAAAREGIEEYKKRMVRSRESAENVGSCDLRELVRLTGQDFTPIIDRVLSRLVRLEDVPASTPGGGQSLRWRSDEHARFRVRRIANLYDRVRAFEELATEDTKQIFFFVTQAALVWAGPLATVQWGASGGAWMALASMTVDVGLTGVIAHREVWTSAKEVDFALGAFEALGYGRLEAARERQVRWTYTFGEVFKQVGLNVGLEGMFKVGVAVAGYGWSGLKRAAGGTARRIRVRRGADYLREVDFDPAAVPAGTSDNALRDMGEYIAHATRLRAMGRPLDAGQVKVLEYMDGLEAGQASWWGRLTPRLQERLRGIESRPDVQVLMRQAGDDVLEVLQNGGKQAEAAAEVLLFVPTRDAEAFRRAVALRLSAPEPLGRPFYGQFARERKDVLDALRQEGWHLKISEAGQDGVVLSIRDPEDRLSLVEVALRSSEGAYGALRRAYVVNSEQWFVPGVKRAMPSTALESPTGEDATIEQVAHLVLMNHFDVQYMGEGLEAVVLRNVVDPETVAHLEWFRGNHGLEAELSETSRDLVDRFLRNTRMVQEVETVLKKAGFGIRHASLDFTNASEVAAVGAARREFGSAASLHQPMWRFDPDARDILRKYALTSDRKSLVGLDIELEIAPLQDDFPTVLFNASELEAVEIEELSGIVTERLRRMGVVADDAIAHQIDDLIVFKGYSADKATVAAAWRLQQPVSRVREATGLSDEEIAGYLRQHLEDSEGARPADDHLRRYWGAERADTVEMPSVYQGETVESVIKVGRDQRGAPRRAEALSTGGETAGGRGGGEAEQALRDAIERDPWIWRPWLNKLSAEQWQSAHRVFEVARQLGVPEEHALQHATLFVRRQPENLAFQEAKLVADVILEAGQRRVRVAELAEALGISRSSAHAATGEAYALKFGRLTRGTKEMPLISTEILPLEQWPAAYH